MKSSNFIIYRSSAGSGKTYTLAVNFISLCLKGNDVGFVDYYRKILAITFTNKAASEMKERILYYFQELSNGRNIDNILSWLKDETKIEKQEIFQRSKKIHQHILHNYSELSISTIDKFVYKIVRAFARDLGFSKNFELEMDDYRIIQPVVALLLSKLEKSGGDLTDALVNFALQRVNDGKSANIEHDLEDFAKQLFKENATSYLKANDTLSIKDCMLLKDRLYSDQKEIIKNIQSLSDRVTSFFNKYGFTKNHFNKGIYYKHFSKNIVDIDDRKWIPSESLLSYIRDSQWYAKSKPKYIKSLVDSHINELTGFMNELVVLLKTYFSNKAVLSNIYSIAVLNKLIKEVNIYKNKQNIQQISTFNEQIHSLVSIQPSLFIYERIGERYNHFLIDEFQDTSVLQWQNILPLIVDKVDYGKTLIVGDGKQSIYRWRGGEVKQFLQLPKIYDSEKLLLKSDWEKKITSHENVMNLNQNYRSKKEIIKFNNEFFEKLKSLLSKDLQDIYKSHNQEFKNADTGGYVYVNLFGDKEQDFKGLILQEMFSEINRLVAEKEYSLRDIVILCNSRRSVALTAQFLAERNIDIVSNEGLLLSSSKEVNFLISALSFLQNQDDKVAKASIITYLHGTVLKNRNLHDLLANIHDNLSFLTFLDSIKINFSASILCELPLFELCNQLIRDFKVNEDIYVQFFLDVVLKYTVQNVSSISEFLFWWRDAKNKQSIVVPEETNAVQIMTIHKAKGLAFNVVMIPFNWEDTSNQNEIWVNTAKYYKNLNSALVNSSKILNWTHFSEQYQKEKDLSLLDNLNKLYVAMTRAKERLYIFSKSIPNRVSDDFHLKGKLNSFLYYFSEDYPIVRGLDEKLQSQEIKDKHEALYTQSKNKNNWKEIVSLKHSAEKIWDTDKHRDSVEWGKLLHLALSKINKVTDLEKVLEDLLIKGVCDGIQKKELYRQISLILRNDKVAKYFTPNWIVKNESQILVNTGETYIPDRLVFDGNQVIVIDYKTGEIEPSHQIQVDKYANFLREMGYEVVSTELLYTKSMLEA